MFCSTAYANSASVTSASDYLPHLLRWSLDTTIEVSSVPQYSMSIRWWQSNRRHAKSYHLKIVMLLRDGYGVAVCTSPLLPLFSHKKHVSWLA